MMIFFCLNDQGFQISTQNTHHRAQKIGTNFDVAQIDKGWSHHGKILNT